MPTQPEFNFEQSAGARRLSRKDGLASWRRGRDLAVRDLAIKLGLPVGHPVEVRLKDGVILRGLLRVGEVVLSLETFNRNKLALQVDAVVFCYGEIESCVRLD